MLYIKPKYPSNNQRKFIKFALHNKIILFINFYFSLNNFTNLLYITIVCVSNLSITAILIVYHNSE